MASRRLGRQLYVPALHLWYRPVPPNMMSTTTRTSTMWTVEIGMTDRGISELGEIAAIKRQKARRERVRQGDELLSLDWDYHVIKTINKPSWTVISGTYRLKAPVNGKVEYLMDAQDICSEDEVLAALSTDADSLQEAIFPLVTERDYLRALEQTDDSRKF